MDITKSVTEKVAFKSNDPLQYSIHTGIPSKHAFTCSLPRCTPI